MIRLITILSMLCMTVFYTYSQELKILSLNNSLIDFNNQPEMFNDIAESEGPNARSLEGHCCFTTTTHCQNRWSLPPLGM